MCRPHDGGAALERHRCLHPVRVERALDFKYRPRVPVFAFSPLPEITRRTALYWGVHPVLMPPVQSTERMVEEASNWLRRSGVVEPGAVITVIAGTPISRRGTTNLLKLHRIEK